MAMMLGNFLAQARDRRAEAVNAFNTPYYGDPNGISFSTNDSIVPDGARMGEARTLRNPMRILQFALKFSF